jgi:hypothetical protein
MVALLCTRRTPSTSTVLLAVLTGVVVLVQAHCRGIALLAAMNAPTTSSSYNCTWRSRRFRVTTASSYSKSSS